MSAAERSRTASLKVRAARWENENFTAGHKPYRAHLENLRLLISAIEFTIARDADEGAKWLREHHKKSPRCPRLAWLERFFHGTRYQFKGKLAAELVLEAAKDVVRMAAVHGEYQLMERGGKDVDGERYRTEDS